jgi:HSP20 family protein
MLSHWTDFDRTLDLLHDLRSQMDRVFYEHDDRWGSNATWPRVRCFDAGANLVLEADVPGLGEKDVTLTLDDGVLTIAGERKVTVPDGYAAQRQERSAYRFSRSVALPAKIDGEKTTATVKNGVLTINLAKAPEARPRQIAVRAS